MKRLLLLFFCCVSFWADAQTTTITDLLVLRATPASTDTADKILVRNATGKDVKATYSIGYLLQQTAHTLALSVQDTLSITGGNKIKLPYLRSYTETDPVWASEKSSYYTKTQADARYLQSFTETDPVWASEKSSYLTSIAAASLFVAQTNTLTINGVTQDLTTSRTFTITNVDTAKASTNFSVRDTLTGKYIVLDVHAALQNDFWGALTIRGTIDNSVTNRNGHAITTFVEFMRNNRSHASISVFDNITATNVPHSIAFQDITKLSGNTTSTNRASFWAATTIRDNASLSVYTGYYAEGMTKQGTATLTTQYGLRVANLTAATTNWAIYTEGTTASYLGGPLTLNQIKITSGTDSVLTTNTSGTIIPVSLSTYLKKADTGLMLSTYLRAATAAALYVPQTTTISINGNTQALTGNLSFTISGGISSMNGLTGGTQTFAIGTSGLLPNFSSTGTTHTLNIPLASRTVQAGLVSNGPKEWEGDLTLRNSTLTIGDGRPLQFTNSNVTITGSGSSEMFLNAINGMYLRLGGFPYIALLAQTEIRTRCTVNGSGSPQTGAAFEVKGTDGFSTLSTMTGAQAEAINPKPSTGIVCITNGNGSTITSTGLWYWDGSTFTKCN